MNPRLVVLLAEDDPNDVLFLKRAIGQLKIPVSLMVVADGEEAIDYLGGVDQYSNRIDYPLPFLFLLDLKMPRRNGFDVLQWVLATPQFRYLPVVVLTGSNLRQDIAKACELGATSYVVKPAGIPQAAETVETILKYWKLVQQPWY
jgi:CheY-like chemotaxis protein